jgi:hypothetical protein
MTPISLIEFRLSRDCSLADFRVMSRCAREEYSLGVPIAERIRSFPGLGVRLFFSLTFRMGGEESGPPFREKGKLLHLLEPTTLIRVVFVRLLPAATAL